MKRVLIFSLFVNGRLLHLPFFRNKHVYAGVLHASRELNLSSGKFMPFRPDWKTNYSQNNFTSTVLLKCTVYIEQNFVERTQKLEKWKK